MVNGGLWWLMVGFGSMRKCEELTVSWWDCMHIEYEKGLGNSFCCFFVRLPDFRHG